MMMGKHFREVVINRKLTVLPISTMYTNPFKDKEAIPIDLTLLFQRIVLVKRSAYQLEQFSRFKLAPYSLNLLNENGKRKTPVFLCDLKSFIEQQQFIQLLSKELDNAKIKYKICDDADDTSNLKKMQNYYVIIVGEDIDLLVLSTQYATNVQENISFLKQNLKLGR